MTAPSTDIRWYHGLAIKGRPPGTESLPIRYFVEGGVYTDTSFTDIVPGTEESYGPFETYEEARGVWRGQMGLKIDTCEHRLTITAYAYPKGVLS